MSAEELEAVAKLKVVELKAKLSSYGLSTSGLKADLAARLRNHLIESAAQAQTEDVDEPEDEAPAENVEEQRDEAPVENVEEQRDEARPESAQEQGNQSPSADTDESTSEESVKNEEDCVPGEEQQVPRLESPPASPPVQESQPMNVDDESTSTDSTEKRADESARSVDRDEMENGTLQSPLTQESTSQSQDTAHSSDSELQILPRPLDTMEEMVQKNLELLERSEKRLVTEREVPEASIEDHVQRKGISLPEKKANETKNQKKKRRKKTRKILKNIEKDAGSDGESRVDSDRTDVEIEYVPDQVEKDLSWFQFTKVFEKFRFEETKSADTETKTEPTDPFLDRLLERKKPAEIGEDDEEEVVKDDSQVPKLSKKKLKQLTRMSVAELKIRVHHPELVEMHDVTTKDPVFLLTLKATRNSVPVPRHWCFKRKYLQGKRGIEKPPFDLPHFIKRTGICEMRAALQEKEEAKTLKSKQREKIRPKMGKIDIDYQKLHDAFFKWQTKPKLCIHGDLYYEGKEFETRLKEKKPGDLSEELRTALGMPTGPNANKCPPPWLIAMQRYGPPPSYPNQKIMGLNAPIPEGCAFGYHAGGWGKPPVDETGKPLYGDVFGLTAAENGVTALEQDVDKNYLFGSIEEEESEEEVESDEEEENSDEEEEPDETGLATPAEGLVTPSGFQSSVSQSVDIPDAIELRKRKIESEMEMGDQIPQLYQVLQEKKTDRVGHSMMASVHTYEIPNPTSTTAKKGGVELALDPSELEMDPGAMAARYEQTVREQQNQLAKEDFSDMVAEHAAKQKNKRKAREEAGSGGKKKYKEFKF